MTTPHITKSLAMALAKKVKLDDTASWHALRDHVNFLTGNELDGWRLDKLTDWTMEEWLKIQPEEESP